MRRTVFLLLAAASLFSCAQRGQEADSSSSRAQGGRQMLSVAVREPGSMDPAFLGSAQDFFVAHQLHVGLYRWDEQSGKVEPALASSAETSADGLEWIFTLDERYRFSDGTPITSTQVVASLTRLVTASVASPGADALDFVKGASERMKDPGAVLGVSAPDGKHVRIRLERPTPQLPLMLASPRFAVVPDGVLAAPEKDMSKAAVAMVSSGPYVLTSWSPRQSALLEPNPNWPKGQGPKVTLKFAESEDSALTWWNSGEVDLVVGLVPLARTPDLRKQNPEVLASFPLRSVYYLVPNVTRPGLDSAYVRRSLAQSLDRQRLVDRVLGAGQLPAWGMLPPTYEASLGLKVKPCLSPADAPPVFPPEQVTAMGGLELLCNSSETHKLIIEYLHSNMKEILSLDWKLNLLEWNAFLSVAASHKFDMIRMSFTGGEDPLELLENLTTGHKNNYGQYSNTDFDALVAGARVESDPGKRNGKLAEAHELLCRDMPVIPVYISSQVYLIRQPMRSRLNPSPDGWFSLEVLGGTGQP